MPGIGIVNNPHSRKNRKHPERMESLGYIVGTKGQSVATRQIEDIQERIETVLENFRNPACV